MKITYLAASMALTKSYIKKDGVITKSSYPSAYEFTSLTEEITDLRSFAESIKSHAAQGHCLLKGEIQRPLNKESRASSTDSNSATDWICLDVDGIPNCTAPDFMRYVKLEHISHIVQYSASYKIENDDLKCHIFIRTDKTAAPAIKQWLIRTNHETPILREAMSLTKTGNSIRWPLDITASQNDKLLYITPPVLRGIRDNVKVRIEYMPGTEDIFTFPRDNIVAKNKSLTDIRIAELRARDGLPARKILTKMHGTTEVMVKPDACVMDNMKIERGFVYFNLNGGDSWGYYHPEDNPEFIHNFKGEPAYLTKELLPEYWKQLQDSATAVRSDGTTYLAFLDRKTSTYWRGTHDQATDSLDIDAAKTEKMLRDYAKSHGMPMGDFIPEWELVFDPSDIVRVDVDNRVINTFQPTKFMLKEAKHVREIPKRIYKVIYNVVGSDAEIADRFINWLAYIVQTRSRTCTSWVFHGTTGTGKGILFHKILRPLLGEKQTVIRNMDTLNEQYNDYMERSFIVFVDEVDSKALINEQGVMAKMRTYITEETIPVRAMYQGVKEATNYTNWIVSSNKATPVSIDREDRRTNVAKYQGSKLDMSQADIDAIETELQVFHDYLLGYMVDVHKVRTPLDTTDRNTLMSVSEASVDTVGTAVLLGDMQFFIEQLPTSDAYKSNLMQFNKVESYKEILGHLIERMDDSGKCNIARDELHTLFHYTIGNMPETPNKFTALLKHHRIHTTKVWIDERAVMGIRTVWKETDKEVLMNLINPPPKVVQKLKAVK